MTITPPTLPDLMQWLRCKTLRWLARAVCIIFAFQNCPAAAQGFVPPAHVKLFPVQLLVVAGSSEQFVAANVLRNGGPLGGLLTGVQFKTDSPNVTVSNNAGAFTVAVAKNTVPGTYHVFASLNPGGPFKLVALLTVPPSVSSIFVTPTSLTAPAGTTGQQLRAFLNGPNGEDVTQAVSWTSNVPKVATVTNSFAGQGLVNFITQGTATISAALSGATASIQVTVTAPVLVSITVTPNPATVPLGGTLQFTATGHLSDGSSSNITGGVEWFPVNCDPANAISIALGLANGNSPGTCQIDAALVSNGQTILGSSMASVPASNPQGGEVLYVASGGTPTNPLPGTVTAFTINSSSGTLTQLNGTLLTGGLAADWIAIHPSGKWAYVVNAATSATNFMGFVAGYNIEPTTGSLTPFSVSPFATDILPDSIAIDPSGKFAYVANVLSLTGSSDGSITAYSIDQNTGALAPINGTVANSSLPTSFSPASLAIGSDGRSNLVYAANANSDNLSGYVINADGSLSAVPGSPFAALSGARPDSMTVSSAFANSFAFVANNRASSITSYIISTVTPNGALIPALNSSLTQSSFTTSGRPVSIITEPKGNFVYAAISDSAHNEVDAFAISSTGALTQTGTAVAAGTKPVSVRIAEVGGSPKFVYVANNGGNDVSGYAIQSDGSLSSLGPNQATASGPTALAVGKTAPSAVASGFAYVTNFQDNTLIAYSIDSATGALQPVTGSLASSTYATEANPTAVALDPSGANLFVTNSSDSTISAYKVDSDGSLTLADLAIGAGTNQHPQSIVVHPSGQWAYVANNFASTVTAFKIVNGSALSFLSTLNVGSGPDWLAVDASGQFLYVANQGTSNITVFAIGSDGSLTAVPNPPPSLGGAGADGIAIDPAQQFLLVANGGSNNIGSFNLLSSGQLGMESSGGAVATGANPTSITLNPSGKVAFATNYGSHNVSVYSVSPTGQLSSISNSPFLIAANANPFAVALDPSGNYAYVLDGNLNSNIYGYNIGASGGALVTPVAASPFPAGTGPSAIAIRPRTISDFYLGLPSPSAVSTSAGQLTSPVAFQVLAFGAFNGTVNLTCIGLLPGEGCNFSASTSVHPSAGNPVSFTVTIQTVAGPGRTPGSYPILVEAVSPDLSGRTKTQSVILNITGSAAADYVLSIPNTTAVGFPSQPGSFNASLQAVNGYSSPIDLNCTITTGPSGNPQPLCVFVPASRLSPGSSFQIIAGTTPPSAGVPVGDYSLLVQATGEDPAQITHQQALTLKIEDFNLTPAAPATLSGAPGTSTGAANFNVTAAGDFSGTVNLLCQSPVTVSCAFSPSQLHPSAGNPAAAAITISIPSGTTPGTYSISIQATSSSPPAARSEPIALVVTAQSPSGGAH